MKTPIPVELELFLNHVYDPVKAREYYLRTRKLKGRKPRSEPVGEIVRVPSSSKDPRAGKTKEQIHKDARTKQRKELDQQIKNLEVKLTKLKALIRTRAAEEDALARKSMGKKERAAKEKDKPKSAAEKAEIARENKKYRDKNQQKLKTQSRSKSSSSSKSGGSATESSKRSVSDLQVLATKVQGQIAVAKAKLAAL